MPKWIRRVSACMITLSLIAALALVGNAPILESAQAFTPGAVRTDNFSDITNHWAGSAIRSIAAMGLASGYNDGTFRPDAEVTRAEFVVMLLRALGIRENPAAASGFRDYAQLGWAAGAIGAAYEAGLISGMPDGSFGAQRNINRAEMAVILERTLTKNLIFKGEAAHPPAFSEKEEVPVWARGALQTTGRTGLLRGFEDGTFRPFRSATRAEVAVIIHRLFVQKPATPPATPPAPPPVTGDASIPSLKEVFAGYFTIGAAVEPHVHLSGRNREMLLRHYNVIVAENAMKPVSIQPREGRFNWASADRIRDFARDNNMRLRFHALVWHNQVPDWFFIDREGNRMVNETDPVKREANKTLLLRRLETHIKAVVERYKNDVDYWEVVNEVIDPNRPDGMRNSQWYQITGKEFIKTAFRAAREAAGEDALLAINDYNTHQLRKRDFLYDLVMELRDEGIRVDIIGHQTHISLVYPSMARIGESIEKFAAAGFRNHVTELDISVYAYRDTTSYNVVPEHLLDQLAVRYRDLFDVFRRLEAHIDDVTFWGIADNHTWLHNRPVPRRDAPFLFDEQFEPKDAFWAVVDPNW